MKKEYIAPSAEFKAFAREAVICASGNKAVNDVTEEMGKNSLVSKIFTMDW